VRSSLPKRGARPPGARRRAQRNETRREKDKGPFGLIDGKSGHTFLKRNTIDSLRESVAQACSSPSVLFSTVSQELELLPILERR